MVATVAVRRAALPRLAHCPGDGTAARTPRQPTPILKYRINSVRLMFRKLPIYSSSPRRNNIPGYRRAYRQRVSAEAYASEIHEVVLSLIATDALSLLSRAPASLATCSVRALHPPAAAPNRIGLVNDCIRKDKSRLSSPFGVAAPGIDHALSLTCSGREPLWGIPTSCDWLYVWFIDIIKRAGRTSIVGASDGLCFVACAECGFYGR